MLRTNAILTIGLAVAAALVWLHSVVALWFNLPWAFQSDADIKFALTLSTAAGLGWVLTFLSYRRADNETRCRKCGYTLRGLSAPRCPECGEPV